MEGNHHQTGNMDDRSSMSGYLTGSERGDLISSLNNAACSLRMLQAVCDGDAQLIEDLEASVQSLVRMADGLKETEMHTYMEDALEQANEDAAEARAAKEREVALDNLARVLTNEPDWKLKVRFVGALGQYEARVTCRGRLLAEQYSQSMTEAASHALEVAQAGR